MWRLLPPLPPHHAHVLPVGRLGGPSRSFRHGHCPHLGGKEAHAHAAPGHSSNEHGSLPRGDGDLEGHV